MSELVHALILKNGEVITEDEVERLKKIEMMAMACDGIDMGDCYHVPVKAWEDLMAAVWPTPEP